MNNFDTIISLGYNCFPSLYIRKSIGATTPYFFNSIATPAWAINELLKNNFDGFFNKDNYEKKQLFTETQAKFLTNVPYYIRLINEPIDNFESFINKYNFNKNNLLNKLDELNKNPTKKLLFIRYEEPMIGNTNILNGDRIVDSQYDKYYQFNELYHLNTLSLYIKEHYPQLNFYILFIGNSSNDKNYDINYDQTNKIFTFPNREINNRNYKNTIDEIFIQLNDIITNNIQ
jgi:hypothetical protein